MIHDACRLGAEIIVMPECAITGYMDPSSDITFTSEDNPSDADELPVKDIAETVPGPSTKLFSNIAVENSIYICIALIEKEEKHFFNSQVLINPEGRIIAHHRKRNLWTHGDGMWASKGDLPVQVVDTPLGKIGLMICYDIHNLPCEMKKQQADIVLYSVGWFGLNTKSWFQNQLSRNHVVPNSFSLVAANWSAESDESCCSGHGYSCIIDRTGVVLNISSKTVGCDIILADLKTGPVN